MALVFIDLFDYTTLTSASIVFFDKVCVGMYFPLSVFKGMNTIAASLPYNYIEFIMEKMFVGKKLFCASNPNTVMSAGCHAKISWFSWRNSMSASSYLGLRLVLMEVVLVASPTTSSTCLVLIVGLKIGGEADTSYLDADISEGSVVAWISLNSSPKKTTSGRGLLPPHTPLPS
jgi:hypothetical protein